MKREDVSILLGSLGLGFGLTATIYWASGTLMLGEIATALILAAAAHRVSYIGWRGLYRSSDRSNPGKPPNVH